MYLFILHLLVLINSILTFNLIICKPYYKIKEDLLKEFRLNEYALHDDITPMYKHYKKQLSEQLVLYKVRELLNWGKKNWEVV